MPDCDSAVAATFLSRWPPSAPASSEDELGRAIARALATARQAWPTVDVPAERFVAHLAERADGGVSPLEALAATRVADLYLACGCVLGDPGALAELEAAYLKPLPAVIRRLCADDAAVDEVVQELRVTLLIGPEADPAERVPRIGQYRGRGALKSWLEVAAKRLALAHKRSAEPLADPTALAELAAARDPELEQLRARHSDEFRHIVRQTVSTTIAALDVEDRNLLRWHLCDGVSLRKLAHMRGVNVSTLSRDFARVRAHILAEVRAALARQAGLASGEVDSMMGALMSRISLSIGQLFTQGA